MNIALIGNGAIAGYVQAALPQEVKTLLVRSKKLDGETIPQQIDRVADLPKDTELVVDCAGHGALRAYGPDILAAGFDLITLSIGALADDEFADALRAAGKAGDARLHLASGAIGALDCLRAAQIGTLTEVRYVGRKPPQGWLGSPAQDSIDLGVLTKGALVHFNGTARDAAQRYPKNANVAAAVALAGLGFDATTVELIADADISANIHEVHAEGDFGKFTFRIEGDTLPDNPRTSALAAMSAVAAIHMRQHTLHF